VVRTAGDFERKTELGILSNLGLITGAERSGSAGSLQNSCLQGDHRRELAAARMES